MAENTLAVLHDALNSPIEKRSDRKTLIKRLSEVTPQSAVSNAEDYAAAAMRLFNVEMGLHAREFFGNSKNPKGRRDYLVETAAAGRGDEAYHFADFTQAHNLLSNFHKLLGMLAIQNPEMLGRIVEDYKELVALKEFGMTYNRQQLSAIRAALHGTGSDSKTAERDSSEKLELS